MGTTSTECWLWSAAARKARYQLKPADSAVSEVAVTSRLKPSAKGEWLDRPGWEAGDALHTLNGLSAGWLVGQFAGKAEGFGELR